MCACEVGDGTDGVGNVEYKFGGWGYFGWWDEVEAAPLSADAVALSDSGEGALSLWGQHTARGWRTWDGRVPRWTSGFAGFGAGIEEEMASLKGC